MQRKLVAGAERTQGGAARPNRVPNGGVIMVKRPARSEVPLEQTWDLTPIYASDEAFVADIASLPDELPRVAAYRGRLADSADVLLEYLEEAYRVGLRFSQAQSYAFYRVSVDARAAAAMGALGQAQALLTQWSALRAGLDSELAELPAGTIERYMEEEPRLLPWQPMLQYLVDQRAHRLTAETEHALMALRDVLDGQDQMYARWRATDLTFAPVVDGQGQELPMSVASYQRLYERSADTALRRSAYRSFVAGLRRYRNTVAALWATKARSHAVQARLRNYPSAIAMLLASQGVPLDLYHRLHDVFLTELAPTMRRLVALRQRRLGLSEMLYCDIEAELDPGLGPVTSFADGRRIICESLAALGPEYQSIIEMAFRDRWIDWAGNEGKTSDSFAGGRTPHPYVLTNWDDSLRGVNTLAHELGHAAQHYLTAQYSPRGRACRPLLMAEAGSTAAEVIVGTQLLQRATTPRERRFVIEQLLSSYYHNLVRHLIEGELQRRLYPLADAGQTITADLLERVQGEILREFWGDAVVIDEGACLTWMRQVHYYSDTLYPYTYSGGITVGTAVARAILREGASAADRWVTALKAGDTLKPVPHAAVAGVDLTSETPMREAVAFVRELVDELIRSYDD